MVVNGTVGTLGTSPNAISASIKPRIIKTTKFFMSFIFGFRQKRSEWLSGATGLENITL
jgi:hypothetical protein